MNPTLVEDCKECILGVCPLLYAYDTSRKLGFNVSPLRRLN